MRSTNRMPSMRYAQNHSAGWQTQTLHMKCNLPGSKHVAWLFNNGVTANAHVILDALKIISSLFQLI